MALPILRTVADVLICARGVQCYMGSGELMKESPKGVEIKAVRIAVVRGWAAIATALPSLAVVPSFSFPRGTIASVCVCSIRDSWSRELLTYGENGMHDRGSMMIGDCSSRDMRARCSTLILHPRDRVKGSFDVTPPPASGYIRKLPDTTAVNDA